MATLRVARQRAAWPALEGSSEADAQILSCSHVQSLVSSTLELGTGDTKAHTGLDSGASTQLCSKSAAALEVPAALTAGSSLLEVSWPSEPHTG